MLLLLSIPPFSLFGQGNPLLKREFGLGLERERNRRNERVLRTSPGPAGQKSCYVLAARRPIAASLSLSSFRHPRIIPIQPGSSHWRAFKRARYSKKCQGRGGAEGVKIRSGVAIKWDGGGKKGKGGGRRSCQPGFLFPPHLPPSFFFPYQNVPSALFRRRCMHACPILSPFWAPSTRNGRPIRRYILVAVWRGGLLSNMGGR